jgi:hypothetical protein
MHYLTSKIAHTALYQTIFDDGYVVWKPLAWSDYKKLREARLLKGAAIDLDLEEYLYDTCVIVSTYDKTPSLDLDELDQLLFRKEDRDEQPAGVISTVAKDILAHSGSINPLAIIDQLDEHRAVIDNIEDQLVVAICRAFPAYTPEDVDKMDWDTVLKRAAQAESIMMNRIIVAPFTVVSEEDIIAAQAAEKFNLQKEIRETMRMVHDSPEDMAREQYEARQAFQKQQADLRQEYMRSRGLG